MQWQTKTSHIVVRYFKLVQIVKYIVKERDNACLWKNRYGGQKISKTGIRCELESQKADANKSWVNWFASNRQALASIYGRHAQQIVAALWYIKS